MVAPPETLDLETDVSTVYYDMNSGEFVVFDTEGDELVIYAYFTGDTLDTFDQREFVEEGWHRDFLEVDQSVVESPTEVVEEMLYNALSDQPTLQGLERREARFAVKATDIEESNRTPF